MKKNAYLRIKELCKEKNIKLSEVANYIEMRDDSFSIALTKETLNVEKLVKISTFLNVSISELFVGNDISGVVRIGDKTLQINNINDLKNLMNSQEVKERLIEL